MDFTSNTRPDDMARINTPELAQAFIDEAAVQCGFCTPGAIMSAVEILNEGRALSDEEIRIRMSGHLCRCTGYENIFRAVKKTMIKRLEAKKGR
jgi:carbon-monoxide dehydrogenase small subunit